jgi:predicted dehydrogenase
VASSSSGSQERIRVAVIGTGFSGTAHVDALSRLPSVEVTGVLASSPERTRAAAERLGVARWHGSLEDLLADNDLDAVHICTPNVLHAEATRAALDADKHVLSEKPLAMDAAQARSLASHAGSASVVTGVCFNYPHFPLVQHLRAAVRGGGYGRPHLIRGAYLQDWLLFPDDWNWRLESARAGATRAIGDIGSHWLDLAQHVTDDRVVAVMADLGRLHEERRRPAGEVETFRQADGSREPVGVDTEDFGSVLLRFASGSRGTLTVSQVTAGAKNRLTIGVDMATASFEWNQEDPNTLRIGRRDAASLDVPRDPADLAPAAADIARLPAGHPEGWADALRNLFEDFYAAIAARRRGASHAATFASFDDAYRVACLVEAIAQSDDERRWVDVTGEAETGTDRRPVAGRREASR